MAEPPPAAPRPNLRREIAVLYRRELRTALRERNIVVNSILVPLLLYPVLLWAVFTGMAFVQGQTHGHVSRVVVPDWPAGHPELRRQVEKDGVFALLPADSAGPETTRERIRSGSVDALLEFVPLKEASPALPANYAARIVFDSSKDRSTLAHDRLAGALRAHREAWLGREAAAFDLPAAGWRVFSLATENIASPKQVGSFVLGRILPVFFVVAVAMGCFQPAIDTVAGERERGTWETLLTTSASRTSIAAAKYLYVATMGGAAGLLNIGALALTLKPILAPLVGDGAASIAFSVPAAAVPVIALAAVLLAGFVAAGMLVFTSFARTFKQAQSAVTPFFMVLVLPALVLQAPALKFTPAMACMPLVGAALMVRSALAGSFPWLPILLTVATSLALAAAAVRLAAVIPRCEDIVAGLQEGGLRALLARRLFRRGVSRPNPANPGLPP
jgi:sodium transport system permease protein